MQPVFLVKIRFGRNIVYWLPEDETAIEWTTDQAVN